MPDDWSEFKKNLQTASNWLDAFVRPAITQAIKIIKKNPVNNYEPLLLEIHLQDASKALDRCLSLRREAYELEIAAVAAAADYKLFLDLEKFDKELEINALNRESLEEETGGFNDASVKHDPQSGFSIHDETLSKSAKAKSHSANNRIGILDQHWQIRHKYRSDYNSRHTTPGNAHNYKERMIAKIALLVDDLQEAYEKLVATSRGIKGVYGIDMPVPGLQGEAILDTLVIWARDVIRLLDIERQYESTYEVVIPLAQKWGSGEPLVSHNRFRKAIEASGEKTVIDFDLSDGIFFNQDRIRLRGVGLAFGSEPAKAAEDTLDRFAYWRLRAAIHTPPQQKSDKPGEYYSRPPIVLGNVSVFGRSVPLAQSMGQSVYNVDPRGQWRIVLNKYSVWSDTDKARIDEGFFSSVIKDLKLYLKIVSKQQPGADSPFLP